MSWWTVLVSVRISMTLRQLRTNTSPLGTQASLPANTSELFCQAADNTRSSLVSRRTGDPSWGAFGGTPQGRTPNVLEVSVTGLTPGTPLTVKSVRPPPPCMSMNALLVLLTACAGCTELRDGFGG